MEKIYFFMYFLLKFLDILALYGYNSVKGGEKMESNICKISNVRSGDLICAEFVYETELKNVDRVMRDKHLIGFLSSGEGRFFLNNKEHSLKRGNAFFVPRNSEYRLELNEDCTYFYISFFGRRGDELVERGKLSDTRCVADISFADNDIIEFAMLALQKANDSNIDILGESVLLYLLAHLVRDDGNKGDLTSKIISVTNERFADPSFSLSMLATTLGYDAKYLSSYFKKNNGVGFSEFLRDIRIRHSIFLMEQGVVYVRNVAILSGFSDSMYYSRVFKQVMGVSPSDYIKELSK